MAGYDINGTGNNDKLTGTAIGNRIAGGAGNDTIYAKAGDDFIYSGAGNDAIYGDTGNDEYVFWFYNPVRATEEYPLTPADGAGTNIIYENTGNDTVYIQGINQNQAEIIKVGNDLVIVSKLNALDKVTIKNFYLGDKYQIENLEFKDTTITGVNAITSWVIISGSDLKKDSLKGSNYADNLQSGAMDDKIFGYGGNDTILGGLGNDILNGGKGDDTYIYNSGQGFDTINEEAGSDTLMVDFYRDDATLKKIKNDLVITNIQEPTDKITIKNFFKADKYQLEKIVFAEDETLATRDAILAYTSIYGTAEKDNLVGSTYNDNFFGGTGGDILSGGAGNDFYYIRGGDGQIVINETSGTDTIELADFSEIFNKVGNDLVVTNWDNANDKVTIKNFYLAEKNQVERIAVTDSGNIFSDYATRDEILDQVYITGDANPLKLNDTITGSAFNDIILSGTGHDIVNAGAGNDDIEGGVGNDILNGGLGDDGYTYNTGHGQDIINETSGIDTIYTKWRRANTNIAKEGNDLVLTNDANADDKITIKNFYIGEGYQVENINFDNPADADINGLSSILQFAEIQARAGFDSVITGSNLGDYIRSFGGYDTLRGGLGNDTYIMHSAGGGIDAIEETGGSNDTLQINVNRNLRHFSRSGNDLVISYNNELAGDDVIIKNYYLSEANQIENIVFNDGSYNGRVNILGMVNQYGLNGADVINGSAFEDVIYGDYGGSSGADTVYAGAGNDTIDGQVGNDQLYGGAGDDVYTHLMSSGFGQDTIYEAQGNDTLIVKGLNFSSDAKFSKSGNDLVITNNGNDNQKVTISGFFTSSLNQVEKIIIEYGMGMRTTHTGVDEILNNINTNGTIGNDSIIGHAFRDIIDAGGGDDTIYGGDGNDIYRFNSSDGHDVIIDTSGNDSIQSDLDILNCKVYRVGNDMKIIHNGGENESISIKDYYKSPNNIIENFQFKEGVDTVQISSATMEANAIMTGNYTFTDKVQANSNYLMDASSGAKTINDNGGSDSLVINNSNLNNVTASGKDLVFGFNDTSKVIVKNAISNSAYMIETMSIAPDADSFVSHGVTYTNSNIAISDEDSPNQIIITGTGGTTQNYGQILQSYDLGGNDTYNTGEGGIKITENAGNETYNIGWESNTIIDKAGNDNYVLGSMATVNGLSITDYAGTDKITINEATLAYSDLVTAQVGNDLTISVEQNGHDYGITIKNYYSATANRIETIQIQGSAAVTVEALIAGLPQIVGAIAAFGANEPELLMQDNFQADNANLQLFVG